ncbi:nitroreductase family protein [Parafrigoribacterium mesophilum]|uniref:nitroreductase family protein n=1 Tax=Parafrigoribacterium mesophilum TaxID=433646 RepID=UPI0031FD4E11
MARRRSYPAVTADAPSHEQLLPLLAVAGRVADHGSLRPWRLLEVRGNARDRLGGALAQAWADAHQGAPEDRERHAGRMAVKPLRAPLLIAIVAVHRISQKVTFWEQDAAAAGVAHLLSLALDDAGWGVMWRTGSFTDSPQVRAMHGLDETEHLLGWLYVGGRPPGALQHKSPLDPADFLTVL